MPTTPLICPNCGAAANGKFCADCGAAVAGGTCASCHGELAPGAKFCHRCGAPAGAGPSAGAAKKSAGGGGRKPAANAPPPSPAATGFAAAAPWAVAGIALVALIGLVAKYSFGNGDGPAADGQQPLAPFASGGAGGGGPFSGGGGGATGVDLSKMSPRQITDRLYDRVMRLDAEGKKDSIQFFAPMAMQAFGMINDPDADTHYDLGRIAQVAGMLPLAKAEADTILKADPKNLLGLTLAMRTARAMGNTKEASAYGKRLIAAAPTERKKDLPGYQAHSADLDEALKEAAK